MAKLNIPDIGSLSNASSARQTINQNFTNIEAAIDKTLSRDGTQPNQMEAELDLNDHKVINVADPVEDTDAVNLRSVKPLVDAYASEIAQLLIEGTARVDRFIATAAQTVFNLTDTPGTTKSTIVTDNGIMLIPDIDYSVVGKVLTFNTGRANGNEIVVRYVQLSPSEGLLRADLVDTSVDTKNAGLIKWKPTGTGAVVQDILSELRRTVRPEHYGAVGDGVHDDTTAVANAIAAAGIGGRVWFDENKTYLISSTLDITSNFVELFSAGMLDRGAKLQMAAGIDAPMIRSTGTGYKFKVNGLNIIGCSTVGTSLNNQAGIYIDTVNNIDIRNCVINNCHDGIVINGVCYYLDVENVLFQNTIRAWIYGTCAVANGIDMRISKCRGTTTQSATYGMFFDGIASLVMSDCVFSPSHTTLGGLYINSTASLSSVMLISNTVFELGYPSVPGVYLKGSGARAITLFKFTNCYFYGDPSVQMDYVGKCVFSNCFFTGHGDALSDRDGVRINNVGTNLVFNDCQWEVTHIPIVASATATSVSLSCSNALYTGALQFLDMTNIAAGNVGYINVAGGYIGSNTNPIRLNSEPDAQLYAPTWGHNTGPTMEQYFVGTLDGSGAKVFAHGITNAQLKVVSCTALYKGGSGEAKPMTVVYVDGNNISISGGGASAHYRVFLRYTFAGDTNW